MFEHISVSELGALRDGQTDGRTDGRGRTRYAAYIGRPRNKNSTSLIIVKCYHDCCSLLLALFLSRRC